MGFWTILYCVISAAALLWCAGMLIDDPQAFEKFIAVVILCVGISATIYACMD